MLRKLTLNPAAILYVVNALVAMSVAWGAHLTTQQTGVIDTIATGVLTVITAFMVRPVELPVAAAAAITVLTAFTSFGLHLSGSQIATGVAVASIAVGFLLHLMGTPAVAAKQGTTATAIMLSSVPNPPGVQ
jgi:hypothetical protein